MASSESLRATKLTRRVVTGVVLAAVVLGTTTFIQERFAIPSLPIGLFREKVVVAELREMVTAPRKEKLKEHTVEESDFAVRTPAKSVAEPPKPKAKPLPEPKLEPKPVPKPKVKKVKRREEKSEVAQKPIGSGEKGVSQGAAEAKTAGTGISANAGEADAAIAAILAEIDKRKRYPRRARQTNIEGTVLLSIELDAKGTVTKVDIAQKHSSALLNRAALKAAKGLLGRHFAVSHPLKLRVPVVFRLR